MATELSPEVQWFAETMEEQLEINCHKPGWEKCTFAYLLRRLLEEVGELVDDYLEGEVDAVRKQRNVLEECADIANFAMMIADNLEKSQRAITNVK